MGMGTDISDSVVLTRDFGCRTSHELDLLEGFVLGDGFGQPTDNIQ